MKLVVIILVVQMWVVNARLTFDKLSDRVVTTDSGRLRGVQFDFPGTSLQSVEAYLGVQYASLRGGDLRFMPPTSPSEKWEGVRIANAFRPVCPQKRIELDKLQEEMPAARVERIRKIVEYTGSQSEDCLYLNVYIPARDRSGPAPVVLFIHGESYDYGTGNAYDGSVLASQADIAVVTLNYRLGPLGFLSTGDKSAYGNYALFDLIAALHWIQGNIADFGGDKSQVTVMGQGHGAALANLLTLAPITNKFAYAISNKSQSSVDGMDLFKRVILQSGSALSSWAMAKDPVKVTTQLASAVNCPLTALENGELDTESLVECLSDVSISQIMNAQIPSPKFTTTFGPVVDSLILEATPEHLMKDDNTLFSRIELLFGLAKYEGSNLLTQNQLDQGISVAERSRLLKQYVKSNYEMQLRKIYDILDHHYSDWDKNNSAQLKHKMIELLGDGQYNVPSILTGQYHIEKGKDTYFYVFGHFSRGTDFPYYQNGHHGEELPYIFGAPLADGMSPFGRATYTKPEKILSKAVIRFFGNFAKSGNPNIPLSEKAPGEHNADALRILDVYWPKYDKQSQQYIQLGTRPLVNHHYRRERVALWTELIPKLHQSSAAGDDDGFLDDEFATSSPKDVGVRHVFPQPPTPPILPPYKRTTTKPKGEKPQSDVVIVEKPVTKVVTKIVEIIKYRNKTVVQLVTQDPSIGESKTKSQMSTAISITVGVGAAFLLFCLILLVGVCCQRSRLRRERRAFEKTQQTESETAPVTAIKVTPPDAKDCEQAAKLLESHLYEKKQENLNNSNICDSKNIMSSSSERSTKSDDNAMEQGLSLSRRPQNDYTASSYRSQSEADTDSEPVTIRGVPQGPARPPQHINPDITFERCVNNFRSNSHASSRSSSRHRLNECTSQNSLTLPQARSREFSPRETPVPRQRTAESLTRIDVSDHEMDSYRRRGSLRQQPMSPRHHAPPDNYPGRPRDFDQELSYDSQSLRMMNQGNGHLPNRSMSDNGYHTDHMSPRRHQSPRIVDESGYRTPRRLKYHENGGSGDSGFQHVVHNIQAFS